MSLICWRCASRCFCKLSACTSAASSASLDIRSFSASTSPNLRSMSFRCCSSSCLTDATFACSSACFSFALRNSHSCASLSALSLRSALRASEALFSSTARAAAAAASTCRCRSCICWRACSCCFSKRIRIRLRSSSSSAFSASIRARSCCVSLACSSSTARRCSACSRSRKIFIEEAASSDCRLACASSIRRCSSSAALRLASARRAATLLDSVCSSTSCTIRFSRSLTVSRCSSISRFLDSTSFTNSRSRRACACLSLASSALRASMSACNRTNALSQDFCCSPLSFAPQSLPSKPPPSDRADCGCTAAFVRACSFKLCWMPDIEPNPVSILLRLLVTIFSRNFSTFARTCSTFTVLPEGSGTACARMATPSTPPPNKVAFENMSARLAFPCCIPRKDTACGSASSVATVSLDTCGVACVCSIPKVPCSAAK
mmetsp:Transcript_56923/g.151984  ORF Transcript_56923/g.151984 Transcript_56923/m.151984 type:complete len:434 (+) Transcript_56923:1099-2400(+)